MTPCYRMPVKNFPVRPLIILLLLIVFAGSLSYGSERERNRTIVRPSEMRALIEADPHIARPVEVLRAHRLPAMQPVRLEKVSSSVEVYYLLQRYAFGSWQDAERVVLIYDDQGRLAEDVLQNYVNNEWVNDDRFVYEYEGNSQYPSIIVWQEWDTGASDWENIERELLQHDGQGREIQIIFEDWLDDEWEPYIRLDLTYVNGSQFSEILGYFWMGDDWDLDYRMLWIYDNGVLVELAEDYWDGEEWWPEFRIVYEYDNDGNNVVELYQDYDDFEEGWEDFYRYLYSYDGGGNRIESVLQFWHDGDEEWISLTRTVSAYNASGNTTEDLYYSWDGEDWSRNQRHTYQYDAQNNLQVWLIEAPDGEGWRPTERYLFGGDPTYVAVDDGLPNRFELMQNYPNPFNPSTTIRFSIPERARVTLAVYDLLGREIAVLIDDELNAGTYAQVFDAAALASGVYLYRLRAGDNAETKRLTLVK
jgi:hypothetical protein